MDNLNNDILQDPTEDAININLQKSLFSVKSRLRPMLRIFVAVLLFFILMTFVLPKKWVVSSDLYINKANNSNMMEINPFAIEELGGGGGVSAFMMSNPLSNEMEIIQSPVVLDKVIKENNLKYKKFLGIIPTRKTGEYISPEKLLKKLSIENKKGTNVISVSYISKEKELSYNVVVSLINNYIELHKIINSDKAKADKKIIEDEYNKAKAALDVKVEDYEGLPANAINGSGALAAMSAFSESARNAMTNITDEFIANERSKMAITEESEKVAELAKKLQWANLVEEMSGTSKVLLLKAPVLPQDWEQASPVLFTQILLGIVFGIVSAFIYLIHTEKHDKKLTYGMVGNSVIYGLKEEIIKLKSLIFANNNKYGKTLLVALSDIYPEDLNLLQSIKNIRVVKADISDEFVEVLNEYNGVILIERIGDTDSEDYKNIKKLLSDVNKQVLSEVLM